MFKHVNNNFSKKGIFFQFWDYRAMEFLWFRFSRLIQHGLDSVKGHWNSHYVIGLHYDIVKGRPNELFYLSELHNTEDFLAPVSAQQCDYITKELPCPYREHR